MLIVMSTFTSCKKGSDDPIISTKSRKDRFTNSWTLNKYEKNGMVQDISGSTYIYNVFNNGTLTQTIEGDVFGFPTRTVNNGTWSFMNDDEDVNITIEGNSTIFNIQRLASKELWLKRTDGSDVHVYYYIGS
jgi:hypothetical protein